MYSGNADMNAFIYKCLCEMKQNISKCYKYMVVLRVFT